MKKFALQLTLTTFLGCLCLTPTATATPIGSLNIANCPGGGVTVTATTITWSPVGTSPGTGCISTGIGTNVAFTGGSIGPGVTGNIKNLTTGGGLVTDFMVFPALGPVNLSFTLNGFGSGSSETNCANATTVGSSCSVVPGSSFVLTYLGFIAGLPTTTISLAAFGTVADTTGISNWSGGFSTQVNETPLGVQTMFFTAGQVQSTHSAQFGLTAIPEPMTAVMIGAGLVLVALIRRPRQVKP